MNFFDSFFQNETKPFIKEQEWLNECLEWIIEVLGFQNLTKKLYHFDAKNFPIAFHEKEFSFKGFLKDVSPILQLNANQILVTLSEEKKERSFLLKQFTKSNQTYYQLTLYNYNSQQPIQIINQYVFALCLIRLIESNFQYEFDENSTIIVYMTMVFFGFGNFITYPPKFSHIQFNNLKINLKTQTYIIAFIAWLQDSKKPKWFQKFPKFPQKHLNNAFSYLSNNYSRKQSIKHYKRLNKLNDVLQESWTLYKKNDYDQAIRKLIPIEQTHPHPSIVYNLLGQYLFRKKELGKGKVYFEKVLELDSENYRASSQLAFYYLMKQDLQKGLQYLKYAANINKYYALNHRNFGIYYAIKKDFANAFHHFDLAIELNPQLELVHYYYAVAKLTNHEKEDAIHHLNISKRYNELEGITKLQKLENK